MAQETIKLNVLYANADHSRQKMETVVTQYFARLLLALQHLAIKQGDTDALRALSEVMIANVDGTSAETFFNKNPQLKDIEVSIPDGALEFSTLLRSITYLASAESVPAEVAAPTETDPKYRAWPALGAWLEDKASANPTGEKYISTGKLLELFDDSVKRENKYSALYRFFTGVERLSRDQVQLKGKSAKSTWFDLPTAFEKLLPLKTLLTYKLTIKQ